ncbi:MULTISPECIES: lysozyme [unclassified Arsenophonus]|uniref:lysozyme n=1 Tax=unclassified Arsenophonus TaxID=2627083 RepID=UPI0028611B2B|nr:lysozyme [Arsenophonus sp.]MDR5610433.1 lysozyme [Arsenophonus sp.]
MVKIPKKIVVAVGGGVMILASSMIMHFEGLRFEPYFDGGGVLSVCYGHTGKDIKPNTIYSQEECEQWLNSDLQTVKKQVDQLIKFKINTLTQAAIYSFVYNVGIGNFQRSTLLKKLNANDLDGACEAMKQ